jgi:uncharacterized protein (TIGR03435 family)
MRSFAELLSRFGAGDGHPVVDKTQLESAYEVTLDIPWSEVVRMSTDVNGSHSQSEHDSLPGDLASDPGGGWVKLALQQLGLRLAAQKAPVERIVVVSARRTPTEN